MLYAAVRHHPDQAKLFWFAIPDELIPVADAGDACLCSTTSYGEQPGKIEAILDCSDPSVTRSIIGIPQEKPIRFLTGVEFCKSLEDIWIPAKFANAPNPRKLRDREIEYAATGRFDTRVCLDPNGMLLDGYSAYVAAKKMGHTFLRGYLMAHR